jgi:hypothetical protein
MPPGWIVSQPVVITVDEGQAILNLRLDNRKAAGDRD